MKHPCHNREFENGYWAQDGYVFNTPEANTRVPYLVWVPNAMSKDCKQWDNFGAVSKGLMDPKGCDDCMWKPKDLQ